MADEERNFRIYYYDKFGVHVVEEKKSVEILLKDNPINLVKLSQFCLRFRLPSSHRGLVWKVLLGVLPPNHTSQDFVLQERRNHYEELMSGLRKLSKVDRETPVPEIYLKVFLLEQRRLGFSGFYNVQKLEPENEIFLAVAKFILTIEPDRLGAYWLTRNFYKFITQHKDMNTLKDVAITILEKEDSSLYNHMKTFEMLTDLPIQAWIKRCFTDILPKDALEKIWDRVVGGSIKILSCVAVSTLVLSKNMLLPLVATKEKPDVTEDVVHILKKTSAELGVHVANDAIKIWEKYNMHKIQSSVDNFRL